MNVTTFDGIIDLIRRELGGDQLKETRRDDGLVLDGCFTQTPPYEDEDLIATANRDDEPIPNYVFLLAHRYYEMETLVDKVEGLLFIMPPLTPFHYGFAKGRLARCKGGSFLLDLSFFSDNPDIPSRCLIGARSIDEGIVVVLLGYGEQSAGAPSQSDTSSSPRDIIISVLDLGEWPSKWTEVEYSLYV